MRPSAAARKSGPLLLRSARSSRMLARSAGSSYAPTGLEPAARRDEHRGGAPAERLGGSLGDRLERRGAGEGLPEHRRDPVEAALDPRLPCALREHLGVPQRERSEAGEGLEDVRVPAREPASLAPADAEHAAHLVAPEHRRGDHVREAVVGRMRNRRRDLAVRALDQRPSLADGRPGQAVAHRELEAEQRRGRSRAPRRSGRGRARGRGGSSRRHRRRGAARAGRPAAAGRPAGRARC